MPDDRLELMFTCCHPALSIEAQVALTLRSLAGLSTAEIARAFLVPEKTMAQRLFRAKTKIRTAAIPFRVPPGPPAARATERGRGRALPAVQRGLLGHRRRRPGPAGPQREAIRLARVLAALMPDEPEALGLLALMLLQDARRPARVDAAGDLVPLEEQDRSRWLRPQITEGLAILDARPAPRPAGDLPGAGRDRGLPCRGGHGRRDRLGADRRALRPTGTAGAITRRGAQPRRRGGDGRRAGGRPRPVDALAAPGRWTATTCSPATRADLLRRLGRHDEAAASYREALGQARTEPERRYLARRLGTLPEREQGAPIPRQTRSRGPCM